MAFAITPDVLRWLLNYLGHREHHEVREIVPVLEQSMPLTRLPK